MEQKIKQVVEWLNILEANRLNNEGYTNECFFDLKTGKLSGEHKVKYKEKKKYFYINFGNSGAFMVEKETGMIYNIKGYGQVDKNKCLGYIQSINENNVVYMHEKRWNYIK